jgi:hypothetical protein
MEAGSHSGIARLVQQSLGTGALFPSYVFVTTYKYTEESKAFRAERTLHKCYPSHTQHAHNRSFTKPYTTI